MISGFFGNMDWDPSANALTFRFNNGDAVPIFDAGTLTLYVDSVTGSDSNTGLSWGVAFRTITAAVEQATDYLELTPSQTQANIAIVIRGTFKEAVTCTLNNITFIGAGPTVNNAIWQEVDTTGAGSTLLTLSGKQCAIKNIRFRVPTTGGIALAVTGGDYLIVDGCHFQGRGGSYYGITLANAGSQCKILNSVFEYLNTASYGTAILGVTYTTSLPTGWEIAGNIFHSNLKHISCTMRQSQIHHNIFQATGLGPTNASLTATIMLDIGTGSAGNGQYNTVTANKFGGVYAKTVYSGNASDDWYGNYCSYVSQTGVTADGITTAVPA